MDQLARLRLTETLDRSHRAWRRDAVAPGHWLPTPPGSSLVLVLFNLMAAFDEGHAILALGPADGPLETFSFYRHGNALVAPALMACLREPRTFKQIRDASGWIVHGDPSRWWNEHVDAGVALACDEDAYGRILAFAREKRAHPGTYDLVTYNCLGFVHDALAQGGVALTTRSGRDVRTIVPKDLFDDVGGCTGALPYQAWKYWFPSAPAPDNGLETIPDAGMAEAGQPGRGGSAGPAERCAR